MPDQENDEGSPEVLQDKRDGRPRPDQPTSSEQATLGERREGAHAEYTDAPSSLADPPPVPGGGAGSGRTGKRDGTDDADEDDPPSQGSDEESP